MSYIPLGFFGLALWTLFFLIIVKVLLMLLTSWKHFLHLRFRL